MRHIKKIRLGLALVLVMAVASASLASSAAYAQEPAENEEPTVVFGPDDMTQDVPGGGGGGEPVDAPQPQAQELEEGVDVSGAANTTTTITRVKKIPGAAFAGPEMDFSSNGGCVWPSNGNSPAFAGVDGIPRGAVVTEMFAEGFNDASESENFTVTLRTTDGDGASTVMATGNSTSGGYVNVQDTTIANATINGLGSTGTSLFLVFDPANTGVDFDLNDHRICQVWITYEVTVTVMEDVLSVVPIAPCAEWDTRTGLPGYTASEGGVLNAGTTRVLDFTTTTCNVPIAADGFIISVFLLNQSGTNWLNIYDASLPNNDEAVIVGSPTDPIESLSMLVPDSSLSGGDVKATMGGSGSAHAKVVITGYYFLDDQEIHRLAD